MNSRNTKLVGVSFGERQKNIDALAPGFHLFWKHDKDNKYDSNAVLCFSDPAMTKEIGHLNKEMAKCFVERINMGFKQEIYVMQVTGTGEKMTRGVNVEIKEYGPGET